MKTHIRSNEVEVEQVAPGMKRQIMGYDSNIMLVKVYFDTGGIGAAHDHPHQQVSYVMSGAFEVTIGDKTEILKEGDCFVVPPGARHGAVCLAEGILIDTFSPMREDFINT